MLDYSEGDAEISREGWAVRWGELPGLESCCLRVELRGRSLAYVNGGEAEWPVIF